MISTGVSGFSTTSPLPLSIAGTQICLWHGLANFPWIALLFLESPHFYTILLSNRKILALKFTKLVIWNTLTVRNVSLIRSCHRIFIAEEEHGCSPYYSPIVLWKSQVTSIAFGSRPFHKTLVTLQFISAFIFHHRTQRVRKLLEFAQIRNPGLCGRAANPSRFWSSSACPKL